MERASKSNCPSLQALRYKSRSKSSRAIRPKTPGRPSQLPVCPRSAQYQHFSEKQPVDLIYRYDPHAPLTSKHPKNASKAIAELIDGNQRLVDIVRLMQRTTSGESSDVSMVVPVDLVSMGLPFWPGSELDQSPFAMVLGCADARVPVEAVFDCAFNDLFVVRIAGNVLGTEALGSFDYAARNLSDSLRAVVVLGHTGCGALTAAVKAYLSPNDYPVAEFSYPLRSLVDRVMLSVRGAAKSIERLAPKLPTSDSRYRFALIEVAVYLNSAITAFDLSREMPAASRKKLPVYYGVCDLQTMLVSSQPSARPIKKPSLAVAPRDAEEFLELGNHFAAQIVERESLA